MRRIPPDYTAGIAVGSASARLEARAKRIDQSPHADGGTRIGSGRDGILSGEFIRPPCAEGSNDRCVGLAACDGCGSHVGTLLAVLLVYRADVRVTALGALDLLVGLSAAPAGWRDHLDRQSQAKHNASIVTANFRRGAPVSTLQGPSLPAPRSARRKVVENPVLQGCKHQVAFSGDGPPPPASQGRPHQKSPKSELSSAPVSSTCNSSAGASAA